MSSTSYMTTESRSSSVSIDKRNHHSISPSVAYAVGAWLAYTGLCAALLIWQEPLAVGLPAVMIGLFAAGGTLAATFFRRPLHLDAAEVTAMAMLFSTAIGGVFGMLLSYTPQGLHVSSYLCGLWIFTFICLLVSLARHSGPCVSDRVPIASSATELIRPDQSRHRYDRTIVIITDMALLFLICSGAIALRGNLTKVDSNPAFTAFYLVNSQGEVADFRTPWVQAQAIDLRYGIVNRERTASEYQVCVRTKGISIFCTESMTIPANERWEAPISLQLPFTENPAPRLDIVLKRRGNDYRSLHVWLDRKS